MSLTRHPPGSLRELVSVALPLMVTSLSILAMVFVDRLLLAQYSLEALNAVVNGSTLGWAYTVGPFVIASITEVFVARDYGGANFRLIGRSVWQMIWFSLMSFLFFGVLAHYSYSEMRPLESVYLSWTLLFAPFSVLYGALSGFFIGQGKAIVIALVALVTNLLNFFLDLILIFGVEGWIPPLGIEGAAIGTSLSSLFQGVCLMGLFLMKYNRITYGTSDWHFKRPLFLSSFGVALPAGISAALEFLGLAIFYEMMTLRGVSYITLAGVFQSLIILCFFVPEGLSKGVMAIAANLMGQGKEELIPKVISKAIAFLVMLLGVSFCLLPLGSQLVEKFFFEGGLPEFSHQAFNLSLISILYVALEGVRFTLSGVLTAYKATTSLLILGVISVIFFLISPVYFFVVKGPLSEVAALWLTFLFPFGYSILLFIKWLSVKNIHYDN